MHAFISPAYDVWDHLYREGLHGPSLSVWTPLSIGTSELDAI